MEECSFCGEEFDSKRKLHIHWGDEHGEELNSHKEEKVKKARRKAEEDKKQKKQKRKKMAFYSLTGVLALAIAGMIVPQLLPAGETSASTGRLDLEGQPMLGNPNASVNVVEFGDYRCPYCKRFEQATFPKLKEQYIDTGKVRFYFINFAFLGPGSTKAAVASECVYQQDQSQFWDYHRAIYENQGPEDERWVNENLLMKLARKSTEGIDYGRLERCISSSETRPEVLSDKELGRSVGVDSTPTVLVNGEKIRGNSFRAVKSAIEQELGK